MPEPQEQAPEPDPDAGKPESASGEALLARLRERGRQRFIWQADARGCFTFVSHTLADVVGASHADILGRRWDELAGRVLEDPDLAVAHLFARHETWSGRTVFWRIAGSDHAVPVDLAGIPAIGADREVLGFRGFGVIRTDALTPIAPPRESPAREAEDSPSGSAPSEPAPSTDDRADPPPVTPARDEAGAVYPLPAEPIEATHNPPENPDSPAPHAEVRAEGEPRSTHHGRASFEAPLRFAPQDEDGSGFGPDNQNPDTQGEDNARDGSAACDKALPAPDSAGAAGFGSPPAFEQEPPAAGEPRSTHDGRASFEAPLRFAPQDEDGSGFGPDNQNPDTQGEDGARDGSAACDKEHPAPSAAGAAGFGSPPSFDREPPDAGEPTVSVDEAVAVEALSSPGGTESGHEQPMRPAAEPSFGTLRARAGARLGLPRPVPLRASGARDAAEPSTRPSRLAAKAERATARRGGEAGRASQTGGAPQAGGTSQTGGASHTEGESNIAVGPSQVGGLSQAERQTFREIARALAARSPEAEIAPEPSPPAAAAVPAGRAPPSAQPASDQGEARLQELSSILDTVTDGIIVIDGAARILSLNRSAEALFGFDQQEVAGQRLTVLFAPESHGAVLDYFASLQRAGIGALIHDGRDFTARVRQGGSFPLGLTIGRIGQAGEDRFCVVLRDITAQKLIESELATARGAADAAAVEKSDFLAKLSHEMRNPLNSVIGFSEIMLEERFGPIGNDRYRDYLRDIAQAGGQVVRLIDGLLDLARIESGRMDLSFTGVSLNDVVTGCVAFFQPQAMRGRIVMRTSFGAKLPAIVADEASVRQIVRNLLANAVSYTQAGGQVIVSTALTEGGDLAFRVRDTGIGMSREDIEAALEPLRRLSRSKTGGPGLGLPLTKALVEANRGELQITSAPHQGTLVEVLFPATRVLAG